MGLLARGFGIARQLKDKSRHFYNSRTWSWSQAQISLQSTVDSHSASQISSNHLNTCLTEFPWEQRRNHSHLTKVDRIGKDSRTLKVQKDPRFSTINDQDIIKLREILGGKGIVTDESELETANKDWMGKYVGASKVLLQPRTTEQISQILGYCNSRKLAIVPQGGNTGLVGGSVPVFDEVILNLRAMNNIISFDEVNGILVCEAGCILDNLNQYLADKGYMMPLDFGAKGTCQIGGNISTNAGGIHLIRYGSLRANVLGLEAVLANGEVIDLVKTLRKDNTGYDLKQLFIGAEGTLGIVTKVSLLTPRKLSSKNVVFLGCESYLNCQKILKEAKASLGEILSAFEFVDRPALEMVLKHLDGSRDPFPDSKEAFYLLVETTGSCESHDREKLDAFVELCMDRGLVSNGAVAQDNQQIAEFWHLREVIGVSLKLYLRQVLSINMIFRYPCHIFMRS